MVTESGATIVTVVEDCTEKTIDVALKISTLEENKCELYNVFGQMIFCCCE